MISKNERNELVTKHMGLATHFASRFQASRMEYDDLVQEAYLGIIDAADRFDPARGKFSTYARWHIMKRIMDAIHNRNEIVRTPRRRPTHICGSLKEGGVYLMEDDAPEPLAVMEQDELVGGVNDCIKQLPNREAIVIRLRHGINTPKLTLREVGDIFGVSPERVRQIQNAAEEKLRDFLEQCAILRVQGPDMVRHLEEPTQPPEN